MKRTAESGHHHARTCPCDRTPSSGMQLIHKTCCTLYYLVGNKTLLSSTVDEHCGACFFHFEWGRHTTVLHPCLTRWLIKIPEFTTVFVLRYTPPIDDIGHDSEKLNTTDITRIRKFSVFKTRRWRRCFWCQSTDLICVLYSKHTHVPVYEGKARQRCCLSGGGGDLVSGRALGMPKTSAVAVRSGTDRYVCIQTTGISVNREHGPLLKS